MWLCGKESGLEGVEANDLAVAEEARAETGGKDQRLFFC